MSRFLAIVLALTMALAVGVVPAGAQPRVGARPDAPQDLQQLATAADFDGDGLTDLAVGAPQEDVGATVGAGAANLFSNTAGVLPAVSGPALLQDNVEAGDRFGAALDG